MKTITVDELVEQGGNGRLFNIEIKNGLQIKAYFTGYFSNVSVCSHSNGLVSSISYRKPDYTKLLDEWISKRINSIYQLLNNSVLQVTCKHGGLFKVTKTKYYE